VSVLGLTSDSQSQLREFRTAHGFPFTMLSDPMLLSGEALDVPISTKKGYLSALALHPVLLQLPKKAYLQPAFFVWRGSELAYQWRQVEKLRNLFGANGRPSPEQILEVVRKVMAGQNP
jgi:hypothetical protein